MRTFLISLLGMITVAHAAYTPLPDIEGHRFESAIRHLYNLGIIEGNPDGTYRADDPINRAAFLKILMLSVFGNEIYATSDPNCFTDFEGKAQWYWAHACTAKVRRIIQGYPDGTFQGDKTVNLAEALKISMEAWEIDLPVYIRAPDNWYDPYMDAAAMRGILNFFPDDPAKLLTRGEMAALIVALGEPIKSVKPKGSNTGDSSNIYDILYTVRESEGECGNGVLEGGEMCDDGNTEDGDGCSSLCITVSEPIRHGALRIEQKPFASDEQAAGSKDVTLFAFDALAGRQDVYITKLKFKSDSGTLGNAQNYRLYVDLNKDSVAETLVSTSAAQGENLSFDPINVLVVDGMYRRFEVKADILSGLSAGTIALGFDTTAVDFVEGIDRYDGEDVSGIELNDGDCNLLFICWIRVFTSDAKTVVAGGHGNLYVTEDSTPVRSHQLLQGSLSNDLLRLNFYATKEYAVVKDIRISGGTDSIDQLEFYEVGNETPFATARSSICPTVVTGLFCATNVNFRVPPNGDRDVLVRARVNPDFSGGTSGDVIILSLNAATSGMVAIEAEGFSSSIDLNQNDGDGLEEGEIFIGRNTAGTNNAITGPVHDVVGAMLSGIENASLDGDDSPVPSGASTIGRFRFTAASHSNSNNGLNMVNIRELVFTVTATNVELDAGSFEIFNTANSSATHACSSTGNTGTFTVTCSSLVGSMISTAIDQGGSIELALKGDVTNTQVSTGTSTLQVRLNRLGDRTGQGTIVWDDDVLEFGWVDLNETSVQSTVYRSK